MWGENLANSRNNHRANGALVEGLALGFLKRQGFTLVQQNFYSRYGEIDLIVANSSYLVFVEVRHRVSEQFGGAIESITTAKQQKLRKTAQAFLVRYKYHDTPCRFDVLCYSGDASELSSDSDPEWIQDAF